MIDIVGLTKSYGNNVVLNNISLSIAKGDIFGILGLSGAGKSTLVRCINGLETFDYGEIRYNGEFLCDPWNKVDREKKKKIAMIFQQFNLLQQRNVVKNVELAGELTHDKDRHQKALRLLELVGLSDKLNSYPSQLSGGQQQRVAIARALMSDPEVLLCDEATSALDAETTMSILSLLKELNKKLGLTIIIIAHQMSVIEAVCNKVAILDKAQVVEVGELNDVFLNPSSEIGKKLIYAGHVSTQLSDERLIKLMFDGNADEPILTNIVQDCNILVSVVFADTKVVNGKSYGQVILRLPYYDSDIKKLNRYLDIKNVRHMEVTVDDLG